MVTVTAVVDAMHFFYESIHDRDFRKTLNFHTYNERTIAPLLRTYLLGWFGNDLRPEVKSELRGSISGSGSIDFVVGDIAVEFAVRTRGQGKAPLSRVTNATEIRKLIRYPGRSLLVLFDLSSSPYEKEDLDRYREWESLGKGNFKRHAFNVSYHYRVLGRPITSDLIRMNVRQ